MAKLFKQKIINQRLQDFKIPDMESKLEILRSWHKASQIGNLKEKSEREVEQSFGENILGNVLGYTAYGNADIYMREPQPKAEGTGQKADFGLGYFDSSGEKNNLVKVVMEVKDARTSLDKPQQREGSLTPVQQGFKYKPFFKSCDFVLVSNFVETRLFYDNYSDYESWTLSDLVNPKDNYFAFRKFYYLLCSDNLIARRGESTTKKLLSDIRIEQESITKKFYKEYSGLRKELFKDIVANNGGKGSGLQLDFALNKTQKIIDRIIFIHFCEDIGLIPNGKLGEKVEKAEKLGFAPWEMVKKFFEFVDIGHEDLQNPGGYNGGLFREDSELNALKVGDDICKKFVDLGRYDFEDDLSVNILGHIFEQSISDIEDMKEQIQTSPLTPLLSGEGSGKVSKRKKDGVFYTPEYIVDYIVRNSVGKKIDDWEMELKEKHKFKEDLTDKNYTKRAIAVYEDLQEKLQTITVLDPACGSGAFLVKVFDFLLEKNKEIAKTLEDLGKRQGLFSSDAYFKSILQNNIYGVDLNEESVEITKLSLWLKTAQKGKKLANLDKNIKCGNSLIDDPAIAGDKAFDWDNEFPQLYRSTRVYIDNSREKELGEKAILKKLLNFNLKPCYFRIDGRNPIKRENPIEGNLSDWNKNNNTPYSKSKKTIGYCELDPILYGTEYSNIELKTNTGTLHTRGKKVVSGGFDLNIKGGQKYFEELLSKLNQIYTEDLINKHFNDFLILINVLFQTHAHSMDFSHSSKQNVEYEMKILNGKIASSPTFITDDISGVFAETYRKQISEKLGLKILTSSEAIAYFEEHSKKCDCLKSGFDVIVGNPPYVSTKSTNFMGDEKKYFENHYEAAEYQTDTYPLFMEKGLRLLKGGGKFGYIIPNSWLNNINFSKLRKHLLDNCGVGEIVIMPSGVFQDATVDTVILFLNSNKTDDTKISEVIDGMMEERHIVKQSRFIENDNYLFDIQSSDLDKRILKKVHSDVRLQDILSISTGIKEYQVGKGKPAQTQSMKDELVFNANHKKDSTFVPELRGKNLYRYGYSWNNEYVSYGPWLAEPRKIEFFEGERIIIRKIPGKYNLVLSYLDDDFIIDQSIYVGKIINPNFTIKYILPVLNSRLFGFYFKHSYGEFDDIFPQIKTTQFKELPIKNIPLSEQTPFIEKADFMLEHNKVMGEKVQKFLSRVQGTFELEKLSKKLQKFYELTFEEFLKELKKKKIILSLKDQDEWQDYFDSYKKEVSEIKAEIDACDREIDEMVFDLYGLSEEEREVVINN